MAKKNKSKKKTKGDNDLLAKGLPAEYLSLVEGMSSDEEGPVNDTIKAWNDQAAALSNLIQSGAFEKMLSKEGDDDDDEDEGDEFEEATLDDSNEESEEAAVEVEEEEEEKRLTKNVFSKKSKSDSDSDNNQDDSDGNHDEKEEDDKIDGEELEEEEEGEDEKSDGLLAYCLEQDTPARGTMVEQCDLSPVQCGTPLRRMGSHASEEKDEEEEDEEEDDDQKEQQEQQPVLCDTNSRGLLAKTEELLAEKKDFPWVEKFDITSSTPLPFGTIDEETGLKIDIHDDLKREVAFYNVALEAVEAARKKCKQAGVPFSRPEDFFAEMVKSDDHMARVKDRLIFENKKIEAVAQRKSNREQKLRAKEAKSNKIAEKARRKRENMHAAKDWATAANRDDGRKRGWIDRDGNLQTGPNKKRMAADKRYGFGGKRGRFKQNSAESMNDLSGFNRNGNFGGLGRKRKPGGGGGGGAGANRKGKRARDANRSRQRAS